MFVFSTAATWGMRGCSALLAVVPASFSGLIFPLGAFVYKLLSVPTAMWFWNTCGQIPLEAHDFEENRWNSIVVFIVSVYRFGAHTLFLAGILFTMSQDPSFSAETLLACAQALASHAIFSSLGHARLLNIFNAARQGQHASINSLLDLNLRIAAGSFLQGGYHFIMLGFFALFNLFVAPPHSPFSHSTKYLTEPATWVMLLVCCVVDLGVFQWMAWNQDALHRRHCKADATADPISNASMKSRIIALFEPGYQSLPRVLRSDAPMQPVQEFCRGGSKTVIRMESYALALFLSTCILMNMMTYMVEAGLPLQA